MSQMMTRPEDLDVDNLVGRRASRRWERVSVGDFFERVRWSTPDKEAVIGRPGSYAYAEHSSLTYEAADRLANRVAQALLAQGLAPGARVLFFCENSVEAYVAKIGVAKAGLVCAPINPRIASDVQAHVIRLLSPSFAFVDAELWDAGARAITDAGLTGAIIPIGDQPVPAGWVEFADLVADAADTEPEADIAGDDIWEIIPTSGTTSMPKCVMLSHNLAYLNAYAHGMTHTRGLRTESDLRIATLLPAVYHAADHSHTFPAPLVGGTLVLGRKVTAAEHARTVTDHAVTALYAGSAQFLDEMVAEIDAHPGAYDLSSLTTIEWAWSPLTAQTAARLRELAGDVQMVEILGQTEALSSTRFRQNLHPELVADVTPTPNYVGLPNPLLAAALMRADGTLVPFGRAGVAGEIVYRSPAVTAGYYRDRDATREAFHGGWFHSGDACMYDENGMLMMIDRYKDVIKSGGENVSSMRVEAVVAAFPGVERVAVVGLPHPRWGEAVTAVVVPVPGADLDTEALLAHCRERLAGYERPKEIVVVDSLPTSVGSKIRKNVLRDQFAGIYVAQPVEGAAK
jgi:acyl-CoA synthetase (AMP-forming)/AMP-acid ligase II